MRIHNGMEVYTMGEMLDTHVGPVGSPERNAYEAELKAEIDAFDKAEAKKNHGPAERDQV